MIDDVNEVIRVWKTGQWRTGDEWVKCHPTWQAFLEYTYEDSVLSWCWIDRDRAREERRDLTERLWEAGMSVPEIAATIGVGESTVRRDLGAGYSETRANNRNETIRRLHAEGMSFGAIGEMFGVSKQAASQAAGRR